MIYKSKLINIKKNNIKHFIFNKKESKKLILKSITQNKNIKPIIRSSACYKISRKKYNYSLSRQQNCCLYTGKIKSVFNKYKMSRHFIKTMCLENKLQNTKLINW